MAKKNEAAPAQALPNGYVPALKAYIQEVKDAGVRVEVRNKPAVPFKLNLTVYYNAQKLKQDGSSILGGTPVTDTIKDYIENLPFNGEFRNVELVDRLQQIDGVVIPELAATFSKIENAEWHEINAREVSYSGYYEFNEEQSNITYVAYAGV